MQIGQAFMGEMSVSLVNLSLSESYWDGALIRWFFHRKIDANKSWTDWEQPIMTTPYDFGALTASSSDTDYPVINISDADDTTEWRALDTSAHVEWDFPNTMKLESIILINGTSGTFNEELTDSYGLTLTDSDGNTLITSNTGTRSYHAKTVNVYTSADKATLIGTVS